MTIEEVIGKYLQSKREINGYSLQDVADRVDKKKSTLHGYEKGRNNISASMLYKLCDLYNVNVDDVFKAIKEYEEYYGLGDSNEK